MHAPESHEGSSREEGRPPWKIDYVAFLQEARRVPGKDVSAVLVEELPYAWRDAYHMLMPRATNIVRFRYGAFEYLYDDYATLEATGAVPHDPRVPYR